MLLVEIVPLWLKLCVFKGELGPVARSSLNSHSSDRIDQRSLSNLQVSANGKRAQMTPAQQNSSFVMVAVTRIHGAVTFFLKTGNCLAGVQRDS